MANNEAVAANRNADAMAFLLAVAATARNRQPDVPERQQARVAGRPPSPACVRCEAPYEPTRSDSLFCSNKCRQAAYRSRKQGTAPDAMSPSKK
jgi:hypothetical protein